MDNPYGDQGFAAAISLFLAIYALLVGIAFVFSVVYYVLMGFSFMKLFRKVGVEPWAAWVPFFNVWRILELGGQQGWFSLFVLISPGAIVTSVFECIAAYRVGVAFQKTGEWVVLFIFLPFVWAWILAADGEVYEPQLLAQRGYGPPLVGYGSPRGPYIPPAPAEWGAPAA
ncbi:MAG TPA: DUF5684 domain-containing protein [Acidimicrobiales bacterium]